MYNINIMETITQRRSIEALEKVLGEISPQPELLQNARLPSWVKSAGTLHSYLITRSQTPLVVLVPRKLSFDQITRTHGLISKSTRASVLIAADGLPPKYRSLLARERIPYFLTSGAINAPELAVVSAQFSMMTPARVPKLKEAHEVTPLGLKLAAAYLTDQLQPTFKLGELFDYLKKKSHKISAAKLSDVVTNLAELNIVTVHGAGPRKSFEFLPKEEVWSGVQTFAPPRLFRAQDGYSKPKEGTFVLASESALARFSMLGAPEHSVLAMTRKTALEARQSAADATRPSCTFQIWHEPPTLFSIQGCLNPIELYLSLRSNTDERVQISLDEMLQKWGLRRANV
jgi:hypothetical protein